MALAVLRDLDTVAAGVARWLQARRGVEDLVLTRCDRPSEGFSSETLLVDARGTDRGAPYTESLVVRLPPSGPGTFPGYDLAVQARAQEVAAAGGVPTAVPTELETDTRWLGTPFLAMPAIAGHVGGAVSALDAWITESPLDAQAEMQRNVLDALGAIHHVDWRGEGLADIVPVRNLEAELAYWERYLDWYGDGEAILPPLTNALAWCRAHRPPEEPPPTLLWGDVRIGNVIFTDERRPAAVLDWEMSTIGPAEHDIAWYLTLQATETELVGLSVPGFLDRDGVIAHCEAQLGRALQDLEWFEIFALVRSTAILTRILLLQARAGQPGFFPIEANPIVGIIERRIAAVG